MSSSEETSITGGGNNPFMNAASKSMLTFGKEHQIYISYLHSKGMNDATISERFSVTFAREMNPEVTPARQRANVLGKIAVYTSKWAEADASETEVVKYSWGPALVADMGGRLMSGG